MSGARDSGSKGSPLHCTLWAVALLGSGAPFGWSMGGGLQPWPWLLRRWTPRSS